MENETRLLSIVREIQTLDAKADKGPWRAQREDAITGGIHWAILPPNEGATVAFVPEDTQQTAGLAKQNAELLARYRTLAVELVREVIDLEKRCLEDRLKMFEQYVCKKCECAPINLVADQLCVDCHAVSFLPEHLRSYSCVCVGMRALAGRKLLDS